MNETIAGKTPMHLWVLGTLSLLWNAFGCYDYVVTHTGDAQALGLDAEAFAWLNAFPAWATGAWAIGVWGSLLGSILLLARKRHAGTVFLVALIGTLLSFSYQFTSNRPASLSTGTEAIMPLVIVIVLVAQWYYTWRQTQAGVLR